MFPSYILLLLVTINAQTIPSSDNYIDPIPQDVLNQIVDKLPTYKDVANFATTFKSESTNGTIRLGRINTHCGKGTLKLFTHEITFINVDHPLVYFETSFSFFKPHLVWGPDCIETIFDYVMHYPTRDYNFTKFDVRLTFQKNYTIEHVTNSIRELGIMMTFEKFNRLDLVLKHDANQHDTLELLNKHNVTLSQLVDLHSTLIMQLFFVKNVKSYETLSCKSHIHQLPYPPSLKLIKCNDIYNVLHHFNGVAANGTHFPDIYVHFDIYSNHLPAIVNFLKYLQKRKSKLRYHIGVFNLKDDMHYNGTHFIWTNVITLLSLTFTFFSVNMVVSCLLYKH